MYLSKLLDDMVMISPASGEASLQNSPPKIVLAAKFGGFRSSRNGDISIRQIHKIAL